MCDLNYIGDGFHFVLVFKYPHFKPELLIVKKCMLAMSIKISRDYQRFIHVYIYSMIILVKKWNIHLYITSI